MVDSTLVGNAIAIKYVSGISSDGKDVYKNQRFGSLRLDINDDEIFAVGAAIMSLMGEKAVELRKTLEFELAEG